MDRGAWQATVHKATESDTEATQHVCMHAQAILYDISLSVSDLTTLSMIFLYVFSMQSIYVATNGNV